jgi:hypothetical protein
MDRHSVAAQFISRNTEATAVRPPTLLETEASTQRANAIYESCTDRGEETQLDAPLRGYYL